MKVTKEGFEHLKVLLCEKIEMVSASRCNLLSNVLPTYQKATLEYLDQSAYELFKVLNDLRYEGGGGKGDGRERRRRGDRRGEREEGRERGGEGGGGERTAIVTSTLYSCCDYIICVSMVTGGRPNTSTK